MSIPSAKSYANLAEACQVALSSAVTLLQRRKAQQGSREDPAWDGYISPPYSFFPCFLVYLDIHHHHRPPPLVGLSSASTLLHNHHQDHCGLVSAPSTPHRQTHARYSTLDHTVPVGNMKLLYFALLLLALVGNAIGHYDIRCGPLPNATLFNKMTVPLRMSAAYFFHVSKTNMHPYA